MCAVFLVIVSLKMLSKVHYLQFRTSVFLLLIVTIEISCHEKTLRKIVRNQSKMVPRPFSETQDMSWNNKTPSFPHAMIVPGYAQVKTVIHKMQRPKVSTILSSVETSRSKATYSKMKMGSNSHMGPIEPRSMRHAFDNLTHLGKGEFKSGVFHNFDVKDILNNTYPENIALETFFHIPAASRFFSHIDKSLPSNKDKEDAGNNSLMIPVFSTDDSNLKISSIFHPKIDLDVQDGNELITLPRTSVTPEINVDDEKPDFTLEELPFNIHNSLYRYNISTKPVDCSSIPISKADIDAAKKFSNFDIEPPWLAKRQYWNRIFNSRYEYLMRNPKWPSLKVILVPRTSVDTIWKRSFEQYHNDSVNKIISNMIKKLKFYTNLTFHWNEVSHLSYWWKYANQKSRATFRKLVKSGRLEITTGGWVESDEATNDIYGLLHLLIEGHQWLKNNINYTPKVAWLTNTVSHSSTMPYLLSASELSKMVFTKLHYSWEKYLAEYQLSDFVWIQEWDNDRSSFNDLNDELSKIGNERYPKYSVLTHYLQFNSADLKACGPNGDLCEKDYNFGRNNINIDLDSYNIKNKSETLLEQYSKAGTITPHNIIMAPIGGEYYYESQTEFDFQYNNYRKIADFINMNRDIYRTAIQFGTPSDFFKSLIERRKSYSTLKGDFLNYADIKSGSPSYWVGYYTSRPLLKISLRRLQSTLRTTELLFTFALSYNSLQKVDSTNLSELLIKARQTVARLQDRNVVSGTLTVSALKYVHNQIASTAKDCWYIQEVTASLLSAKPDQNITYLQKYVYRDGEFTSAFRTVGPGDQIYLFNSQSHERTDIVELITRNPNVRITDHNKKEVTIQINPVWKYNSKNFIKISKDFFKINFVITVPPMTLELFKVRKTYDAVHSASTVYCLACKIDDEGNNDKIFPFDIQPLEFGDIQLENYKQRLVFDEFTGFLKNVIDKDTNTERTVSIDFGAFKSSHENAGMFLFNTNVSRPLYDILSPYRVGNKAKLIIITSGQITTEVTSIYGRLLQHTVKIFNLMSGPLSNVLQVESRVDLEVSPNNRDLEIFLSVQTDISNGNHPEIFVDTNGFQYVARSINISRRVESNIYPMTNMAFIQDQKSRFTIITDHAQGVTALQEGQIVVMLDRRILYNDQRGTDEGLADSSMTIHRHNILLEIFSEPINDFTTSKIVLPSLSARHLSNFFNHMIEIFIIDTNYTGFCQYAFFPLVKSSFPCDVVVVNYRASFNKQLEKTTSNSALMTLHRQSFSCRIHYDLNTHCTEAIFTLENILRYVKGLYRTNLVGTGDNVPISDLDYKNFPPMTLITLRIYF